MQTILGAGGAIGIELAKELTRYTNHIRLVSRNPKKVNDSDETFSCDLTNKEKVVKAIGQSEVAYLTAGLPYDAKVWETTWPVIMQNVLDACKFNGTRLVFFDNIYMYDPEQITHATEQTPVNPSSRKGKVREYIANRMLEEVQAGNIKGLIARSADFYGPDNGSNSVLIEMVIKPLSEGKKANWLGGVEYKHSFTYSPDAGKATALLGNTKDAYGEIWHLPTVTPAWTGKQWIEESAAILGVKPRYRVVSKWMTRMMGLFVPVMREFVEMYYQYDRDYVFDSSKFQDRFDFTCTPIEEGLKRTVQTLSNKNENENENEKCAG